MFAPLSASANIPSPNEEQKWDRDQNGCKAAEYRGPPVDTNIVIHGQNEQRKCTCHHGPKKGVCRDGTGTEAGESVNQVVESRLKNGCESKSSQGNAND